MGPMGRSLLVGASGQSIGRDEGCADVGVLVLERLISTLSFGRVGAVTWCSVSIASLATSCRRGVWGEGAGDSVGKYRRGCYVPLLFMTRVGDGCTLP